jgi:TonB family protein
MNRCFLLIILLGLSSGIDKATESEKADVKQMLEQAQSKSIFTLPSFQIKADIRISNNMRSLDGSYLFLWNGPNAWREEITLEGFSEIRVGGKGIVSIKRNSPHLPLRIHQLHRTLGFGTEPHTDTFDHFSPAADEIVKSVGDRKIRGLRATCAEILFGENRTRRACIETSTGMLIRDHPYVDKDKIDIEGKFFPRFLSYVEKGKAIVEVQIKELKAGEQLSPSSFVPPEGAASTAGCMNPAGGQLDKHVQPKYPKEEIQSRIQGTVAVYTLIGTDGVPRELNVVSGVSPGLNQSSMDALQQWRYTPATCDGTAVPIETILTVHYSIEPY